ncbi:DUF1385 domain-containing protein [Frisingicoccus sp.]|uniref:DUF1385 domain-containing protein n=1 Tax=Frisingicoccus sp. TaxID=1918627 RepID=UPI0026267C51|nr:DUF1385 domain-containing protein [Frisingicoccus sp.]MDD6232351.1 DUF1385 domain-containing protein [Frisingicoccus sp.]MDY4834455.1 DUF1385 domain-containing protein [Frisingicoccus sp.]MDY4922459.1 DUF1385 domain-containing protein [Frisingicoccus sp.]
MKYANIGGQAVMEGVMMRHKDHYAVAVRKENHEIEVMTEQRQTLGERYHVSGIPIIRGVFAFVDSLVVGMKTLMWSASFFEDEEETSQEKEKQSDTVFMTMTVIFSLAFSIGLFMILPFFVSNLFKSVTDSSLVLGIIEGLVRVLIFIIYILAISRMKDIQRLFMYHGAEHKTINCIEHGDELTPENAAKYSRFHKRCGTSFLFIVMFISIVFFLLFFQIFPINNMFIKVICRILLVPVIAGISYEIIQWAGRHDSGLVCLVSKPGFWMQKFTTKEPDREMLEVAIASIEAIYDWREFQKDLKA